MQVKELKSEGLSREIEITVSAQDISTRIDERLAEVGKTLRLPGFRPGKAPLTLVRQRYGKAVMGEVLEKAVNDTTAKALQDKGIKPALQPKIEVKEFDEGKDLKYTVAVEVLPEFKVAELKGVKLEKPVAKVSDKSIDEALTRIAGSRKDSQPIEGKRATKKGDIVVMDYKGRTADGTEYPGMAAQGARLELGSGQFIPGFEDQLTGRKAGESVEVKVTFPDPYQMKELAGQDAIFDVTLHEIREPKPVEINDEFAKNFGMDDVKALRKAVEEQLGKEYAQQSRMKVKRTLLDWLDEKHEFELPSGMVDMEFQSIERQVEHEASHTPGSEPLTDEEREELRGIAERRVRLGLVLAEVGRANNLTVTDQELQRAVIQEAQRYQGQERQVFEFYQKNRQALEGLKAPIFEDKVVDFILEMAEIKENEVTPEELAAEDDRPAPKARSGGAKKTKAKDDMEGESEAKKPAAKKAKAK